MKKINWNKVKCFILGCKFTIWWKGGGSTTYPSCTRCGGHRKYQW